MAFALALGGLACRWSGKAGW